MDARMVEEFLEKRVKRLLGKHYVVTRGPEAITKYSGIRPEVFIHAAKVKDFGGVMPDGAHTARRPAKGPSTFKGFEEERPGRIILVISCMAGNYKIIQDLCHKLTPEVLLSFELMPKIPLGALPNNSVQLHFEDYTAHLHKAKTRRVNIDDSSIFKCKLVFYLNGFIHVWLTKRGGFSSQSTTRPAISFRRKVKKIKVPPKKK